MQAGERSRGWAAGGLVVSLREKTSEWAHAQGRGSVEVRNGSCQGEVEPGAGREGPERRGGAVFCTPPALAPLPAAPKTGVGGLFIASSRG